MGEENRGESGRTVGLKRQTGHCLPRPLLEILNTQLTSEEKPAGVFTFKRDTSASSVCVLLKK